MAATFLLEIATPDRRVFSGRVAGLVAPGAEGYFGILARHAPMLAGLKPGEMKATDEAGRQFYFAVSGGFVQVLGDRVVVLADAAESPEQIDVERAAAALDRARERLRDRAGQYDSDRAEAALRRALNRLRVANMRAGRRRAIS
jgi:F-type H+-transporting ATPase subunit epsilon